MKETSSQCRSTKFCSWAIVRELGETARSSAETLILLRS